MVLTVDILKFKIGVWLTMRIKPKAGDRWEFKPTGKPKRTKEVGRVDEVWGLRADGEEGYFLYVHWARQNKGRYTGISMRRLMEIGHRVSTKVERDARTEMMIERARAKRQRTNTLASSGAA